MQLRLYVIATLFLLPGFCLGQVGEIKKASVSRSGIFGDGSGGGSGFMVDFFFQFVAGEVVYQQQHKLEQKHEIPSLVSLDVWLQGAAQPSSYYILNPRVRLNWGLFSTDFRLNYIVEEDIDGIKYLRTNDWQVIQFNLVTTPNATFRVGGGFLQEAYGERNSYPEWTCGLHIRPATSKLGGIVEVRASEARNEVNGHLRYSLFDKGRLHGYFTGGVAYQRYYRQVSVWGFQGGLAFSIY